MTTQEQKAREFAQKAHKGQYRKDGTTPYFTHCEAVVNLLKTLPGLNDSIYSAGYLHDTKEDCQVTSETLRNEFNSEIERIVSALTRDCSREEYKARILNADYAVQIVKLADLVHNCSCLNADLPEKTIRNKVNDCKNFYFELAAQVCLPFHQRLMCLMSKYLTSEERAKYAGGNHD